MSRWLFRFAVALVVLGVVAALTLPGDPLEEIEQVAPGGSETPSTTSTTAPTTTTEPPLFDPPPERDEVRAIRTTTGVVVPVMGRLPEGWEVLTPCAAYAVVEGTPLPDAHVVLDPGHGGSEPGAVGPSGQVEADVNLDIAHRVAELLRAEGASVVLTRDNDMRVTLETRAAIATALEPEAFISIHHNASPLTSASGPGSELYHQLADPESKRLAGLLWDELQEHLTPFSTEWAVGEVSGAMARQSVRTGDDYYGVLRRSQGVPAVLTEAVFLSDPEEDALLRTEEFRAAEARAIADAVIRLVSTDDPGSGFQPPKVSDVPAGGGGGKTGCEDPPLR